MNYLKRRFSSGDLQNEHNDSIMMIPTLNESSMITTSQNNISRQSVLESKSSTYTSAPTSPTRSLSFANHFINAARGVVHQAIQQIPHHQAGTGITSSHQLMQNKDRQQSLSNEKFKLLLVIDDQHTDW